MDNNFDYYKFQVVADMRHSLEHMMVADNNIVAVVGVHMKCDNFVWVNGDRHSFEVDYIWMLEQVPCSDTQGLVNNIDGRKLLRQMGVYALERQLDNFYNQHACEGVRQPQLEHIRLSFDKLDDVRHDDFADANKCTQWVSELVAAKAMVVADDGKAPSQKH